MNPRCCLCGRFMSDDDVLLGFQRAGDDAYAHDTCTRRHAETIDGKPNEDLTFEPESRTMYKT